MEDIFEKFNIYMKRNPGVRRCLVLILSVVMIISLNMQVMGAHSQEQPEEEISVDEPVGEEGVSAEQEAAEELPSESVSEAEEGSSEVPEDPVNTQEAQPDAETERAAEKIAQADPESEEEGRLPENLSEVLGDRENWPGLEESMESVLKKIPLDEQEIEREKNATKVFSSEAQVPALSTEHIRNNTAIRVFAQTDRDFAKRDASGVLRNENGSVAEGAFQRFIGTDLDGRILFTADAEGTISYEEAPKVYFNSDEGRFYSDRNQSVELVGIEGILDSSDLELDGESIMTLLNLVDGTLATVEVPGKNIYP
ncbi:MAG: hypothetical protein IJV04_06100, partial [Lachnospiraceae bacterium]|nr:hypothetical protein [Lachnospiraceae bacterium]